MASKGVFLLTTTNTLEGWSIKQYLAPVTAHIVAGTGLFSDFAASFSDIFGGRSQTYQKQLSKINEEAINLLREKAQRLGANCIVGLRIDHDEVSGKAKQMFMVTASGTAVIVDRKEIENSMVEVNERGVDAEDVRARVLESRVVAKLRSGPKSLEDWEWDVLLNSRTDEAAKSVARFVAGFLATKPDEQSVNEMKQKLYQYVSVVSVEGAKDCLYSMLTIEGTTATMADNLIRELNLMDVSRIRQLLEAKSPNTRYAALKVLKHHGRSYSHRDLAELEEIVGFIEKLWPRRPITKRKAGMLGNKEKEAWECLCATVNDIDTQRCKKCGNDIFGLPDKIPNPKELKEFVNERATAIKYLLGIESGNPKASTVQN